MSVVVVNYDGIKFEIDRNGSPDTNDVISNTGLADIITLITTIKSFVLGGAITII
jgi:hypothetical protein